jgi:hypothetical protein
MPLVCSTVCCNVSRKQAIVAETYFEIALSVSQQSLACLLGGLPLLIWEPILLIYVILGRQIADVDQEHVSMESRADVVG